MKEITDNPAPRDTHKCVRECVYNCVTETVSVSVRVVRVCLNLLFLPLISQR